MDKSFSIGRLFPAKADWSLPSEPVYLLEASTKYGV
jgi:hypothetical protein